MSRAKHRYPNVRTPWHKTRRHLTYQLEAFRYWLEQTRLELQDIVAEYKERNK